MAAAPRPGVLAPGDVLRITYVGSPELNQTQKIRADGRISLPSVGEVQAAGKWLGSLQSELRSRYRSFLTNPEVVLAVEASSTSVYVSGAVVRPGRIPLGRPMTVLEGVMEAGGFAPGLGDPSKVVLIRTTQGQHSTQVLNLNPALRGLASNAVYLRANDVIFVHERFF